ncbi:hypothetical protein B0H19DRAFT_938970 [Mycena capillaripes]|nr:hypothetical protein B0H19DRAFT_938970 [Mycena capillaripes]
MNYTFEATRRVIAQADADAQSSLTLLRLVIATGFSVDGQNPPVAGASIGGPGPPTSVNNFINFCALNLPLTNGLQITTGSCNPAPMGVLPASNRLPASKFTYPRNGGILAPNAPMTIGLAVTNLAMGNLANLNASFLAAPQQLDANGNIQGHPLIVVDQLSSFNQSEPTNPTLFLFAKGIAALPDSTGVVTTTFPGLPVGFYRMSSIIRATNGQPVLLRILQHGAVDDAIYVWVFGLKRIMILIGATGHDSCRGSTSHERDRTSWIIHICER